MDSGTDFAAIQQQITSSLVAMTRTASKIATQDLAFHRSIQPDVAASLDQKSARLLQLTERLLQRSAASSSVAKITLPDVDAIDSCWRRIVDVADSLFERADTCLDEFTGLVKNKEQTISTNVRTGWTPFLMSIFANSKPKDSSTKQYKPRLNTSLRDAVLPKPQLSFDTKPPNYEKPPFRHFLSSKPHSTVPFAESFKQRSTEDGIMEYHHPYQVEIEQCQYPDRVYTKAEPIPYHNFDTTQATFVDTLEGVDEMLEHLKNASEIAIDLEHHDAHSYIGLVSLMQISTRDHDWIVDTLKPWRRRLEKLNEVFADPKIVKVLHGAHMDIVWLQRDLGLYVVGLFDTFHASRVLNLAGGGLAFLLLTYVNFDAQKQYQTADWRIRPIPAEMLKYARSDTHFLLYIYDCLRNQLVEGSDPTGQQHQLATEVLNRSKDTALQRYQYSFISDDITSLNNGWAAMLCKYPADLNREQVAVLAHVYRWRDDVGRQEDESTRGIMANHVVLALAKAMPEDKIALLAMSHPISPILRSRADELLATIVRAREGAGDGPDSAAVFDKFPVQRPRAQRRQAVAAASKPAPATSEPTPAPVEPADLEPVALQPAALDPGPATSEAAPALVEDLAEGKYRSQQSHFWGSALPLRQDAAPLLHLAQDQPFTLQLPLQTLENGSALGNPNTTLPTQFDETGPPEANTNGNTAQSTTSNKRRAQSPQAHSDSETQGTANPSQDTDADAAAIALVQKRAQRKANKRARLDPQAAPATSVPPASNGPFPFTSLPQQQEDPTASTAFDYNNAPSVLRAKRQRNASAGPGSRPPANPYAKGEGAAVGLKRAQNPAVGRSFTFRE